jgi:hypothetical protein
MAKDMTGKKFELKIRLEVCEDKGGGNMEPFFDNDLTYHGIGYDGIVAIESGLIDMLTQMNEWGLMQAMEGGLGERLSALGLDARIGALAAAKKS